jgi:hypothetical protein
MQWIQRDLWTCLDKEEHYLWRKQAYYCPSERRERLKSGGPRDARAGEAEFGGGDALVPFCPLVSFSSVIKHR